MNKKNGFVGFAIAFLFLSCTNFTNIGCKTAKDLMKSSIEAINNENKEEYISLIDVDIISEIFEKSYTDKPDYKEIAEMMKNDKAGFIEMYSVGYNIFIGTLKKIHKIDNIGFELIDFTLEKTEKESGHINERYVMKLKDSNNDKWSLKIYLSKYNECYYITLPVDVNFLKEGW